MKKYGFIFIIFMIAVFSLSAKENTRYIAVQKIAVKESTWFFAKTIGEMVYSQEVEIAEEKNKWIRVFVKDNPSISGWIPLSSVTSKKIVLRSGDSVSTSADELALAGKGFSKEVEDTYKQDKKVNYDAVDQLEAFSIDSTDLYDFITEGDLNGGQE